MTEAEQKEMREILLSKLAETREEIEQLTELTKPIAPDNAYGRLSRMDAIRLFHDRAAGEGDRGAKSTGCDSSRYCRDVLA